MSRAKWARLNKMMPPHARLRELGQVLLCILACATSLSAAETAPPPQRPPTREAFHLFLVIGTGGVSGPSTAAPARPAAAIPTFLYQPDGSWRPLPGALPPADAALADLAQGLASGLKDAAAPGHAVGLIPCAARGSSLADWAQDGPRYAEALRQGRAALRQGTLQGILWVQGPANPTDAAALGDRLTALAADLRQALGAPRVPFVASRPADVRGRRRDSSAAPQADPAQTLLEQLTTLPHRIPVCAVVDVRGLAPGGEAAEFDPPSLRELGRRFALATSHLGAAPPPSGRSPFRYRETKSITIEQDVVIGQGGGRDLHVDLAYLTAPSATPRPAVLMIHGGGWSGGTHKGFLPAELASQGYFVASVEYRLSGEAPWPAQIQDCKLAVRWLRAHAAQYHVNPERIGCLGFSAGGHLAACLGTLGDAPELEGSGGSPGVSSRVQAVVDESGPTDFTPAGRPLLGETERDPSALVSLLGGGFADKPAVWRQASPALNVTAATPPFLILSGEKDNGVPVNQALRMESALKKAGIPVQLIRVKNGGHGLHADHPGDPAPDPDPKAQWAAIVAFLDGALKH